MPLSYPQVAPDTTPDYLCRGGEKRHGRVYSLRIDPRNDLSLHMPSDFNELRLDAWNPNNLKKDCQKVARHVARTLDVTVEIVKHLADGDRTEGWY
jgi:hypothetical protein